jgi:integrase
MVRLMMVLELGAGHGRDSIFFASNGLEVEALDYSAIAVERLAKITKAALATYGLYLVRFAQKVNKPFGDITLNDLLGYLETLKKPDSDKWRETWNLFLVIITRFFKWFYYPNIPDGERPKPAVVVGLKKAKPKGGKRKKVFGPKDLWDEEDNEIFFKYCPDARIKGYHGLAIDTGARPHELLQLKMQDVVWPPDGQGPKLQLNGKTGPRTVRSMRYYRYGEGMGGTASKTFYTFCYLIPL